MGNKAEDESHHTTGVREKVLRRRATEQLSNSTPLGRLWFTIAVTDPLPKQHNQALLPPGGAFKYQLAQVSRFVAIMAMLAVFAILALCACLRVQQAIGRIYRSFCTLGQN